MSHTKKKINLNELNEDSVQVNFFTISSNPVKTFWENVCEEINLSVRNLSKNYIWHRDEFKVYLPIENGDRDEAVVPTHLTSTVCIGDNIEDEWYIVHLVMELSKIYKELIIQIVDSDGDFLLIEAANCLPLWANPESTENRVFIYNGSIHLIPPKLFDLRNSINIIDALKILKKSPEQTKASSEIHESILARIGSYPQKIEDNFHRAVVKLPLDVAALLTLQPSLIAPIVTAYCNHDVIDTKSCRNLDYKDFIPVEIKFTKCLYAMLMHSKVMRHLKNDFTSKHKKDVLGIKLTCGFQIIMKILTNDIFCTKEYKNFEKNLKDNGYFRDNIESSSEYNLLRDQARKYFRDVECPTNLCVSEKISEIMTSDDFLRLRESLKHRNKDENILTEDNEDWLTINPDQLNDLLNKRYGDQVKFKKDDIIAPETITSKLTNFLKQTSDFQGVETHETNNTESDYINFDADQFEDCLENIMNLLSSDINEINLEDDSDMEDESGVSDDVNSDDEINEELASTLHSFEATRGASKTVVFNLTQSIKQEGFSGPSSNLLTSIGINKTELLDSDDD